MFTIHRLLLGEELTEEERADIFFLVGVASLKEGEAQSSYEFVRSMAEIAAIRIGARHTNPGVEKEESYQEKTSIYEEVILPKCMAEMMKLKEKNSKEGS